MNDQSNPAPNYWFNQARAHIAQFNKLHDQKRGEEKSNLQPDLPSTKRKLKSCLRAGKGSSKSQKELRPEVRRHRKVRFEGITDNESPSQSLPSRPHRLRSPTSSLSRKEKKSESKSKMVARKTVTSEVKILSRRLQGFEQEMKRMRESLEEVQLNIRDRDR